MYRISADHPARRREHPGFRHYLTALANGCGLDLGQIRSRTSAPSRGEIGVVIRWDEKAGLRTGCCTLPSYRRARSTDKRRPAMKKVSTVAAKASRKISSQKLTVGLDLGDRSSWYCVLDEAGSVLLEQRLSTTSKALREVFVAHARNVRLIGESRKKDDRLDAQTLARLARIDPGLLSPVKHRSAKAQADLSLIRARAGLVRARTALVNTARGLAKSYGERLRGCNVRNLNPEKAEGLSPELQAALEPLLAALE